MSKGPKHRRGIVKKATVTEQNRFVAEEDEDDDDTDSESNFRMRSRRRVYLGNARPLRGFSL